MTTATIKNEAAERLRGQWEPHEAALFGTLLDAALEIARRTTVQRIRAAALAKRKGWGAEGLPASLKSILDAEDEGGDLDVRWLNLEAVAIEARELMDGVRDRPQIERLARAINRLDKKASR